MIVIISGVCYMNWHLDKDFRNGLMQGIISEMKSSYKKKSPVGDVGFREPQTPL